MRSEVYNLRNDLRAIERTVADLVEKARLVGFDEDLLRLNLRVGLTEALANAMLYGNNRDPRKQVRVEARFTPDEIEIRVTDQGRGFNPDTVRDPTTAGNVNRAGGRGIFLIRKLMDRVEFNERGNSVLMVLHARPGRPRRRASGS
jgi:serine/threonine-protein kinase RsbW